ncbi:hypothetical protein IFR04_002914 [Cadophora malorum]|uniref:Secreted protein n=1 Tax=Cadophora malorum TaxID=108018 RepID=A0A8H7WFL9_9HELO|nr:hypothetical protein IFR04_002914 [Cadophora malorum]
MKLLYLTTFLVMLALSIFSADVVSALPSPSSQLSLRPEHASELRDGESSAKDLNSKIFDKASLQEHFYTMIHDFGRSTLPSKQRFMTDVNCLRATGQNWSPAPVNQAQSAVDFLKATTAFCAVSARSCVRVSCVEQAAVYLCNNNNDYCNSSCFKISKYAQALIDQCLTASQGGGGRVVGGQAWNNENWNVFIRGESCD